MFVFSFDHLISFTPLQLWCLKECTAVGAALCGAGLHRPWAGERQATVGEPLPLGPSLSGWAGGSNATARSFAWRLELRFDWGAPAAFPYDSYDYMPHLPPFPAFDFCPPPLSTTPLPAFSTDQPVCDQLATEHELQAVASAMDPSEALLMPQCDLQPLETGAQAPDVEGEEKKRLSCIG